MDKAQLGYLTPPQPCQSTPSGLVTPIQASHTMEVWYNITRSQATEHPRDGFAPLLHYILPTETNKSGSDSMESHKPYP